MGSFLPDSAPADSVINVSIYLSKFGLHCSVTPYSPDLAPPGIANSEAETETEKSLSWHDCWHSEDMRADLSAALNTSLTSDSKLHMNNVISVLGPTQIILKTWLINKSLSLYISLTHVKHLHTQIKQLLHYFQGHFQHHFLQFCPECVQYSLSCNHCSVFTHSTFKTVE
jgi:hypothetical protein